METYSIKTWNPRANRCGLGDKSVLLSQQRRLDGRLLVPEAADHPGG